MLNEDETTIFLLYTRQCQNESERTHTEKETHPIRNHFCALAKNHLQTQAKTEKVRWNGSKETREKSK